MIAIAIVSTLRNVMDSTPFKVMIHKQNVQVHLHIE